MAKFSLEFSDYCKVADRIQNSNPYRINFLDLYLNDPNHEIFQNQSEIVFSGRVYITDGTILIPRQNCNYQEFKENKIHDPVDKIFISTFCQK